MARRPDLDDRGIPTRCSGCGKRVLDGAGNQEETKRALYRYCDRCWKKRCDQLEAKR